jgi:acyl-CoA thioesterase-1
MRFLQVCSGPVRALAPVPRASGRGVESGTPPMPERPRAVAANGKGGSVIAAGIVLVLICGIGRSTGGDSSSARIVRPDSYLRDLTVELSRQWPKNRTVNVVCHGHSVPAGYFQTPVVDTFNAYPHLLHRGLKERFPYAVLNVIVTAIGGENSESGAKRFKRDVLSLRPDLITIDYALNDRGIGLARAEMAWKAMIAQAQAAHVPVILLTPTPDTSARLDDPADPLNQHAEQIRRLAREQGVALVDSLAAFKKRIAAGEKLESFMSQVNHPNRKGHDIVAAELLKWFP